MAHFAQSMRTIADGLRYGMRSPVHYEDLECERLRWCAAHGYATAHEDGKDKPRQDILSTSAELTGSDATLSLPLRCVDKFEEP